MSRRMSICLMLSSLLFSVGCGTITQSYLDSFVAKEKLNTPKRLFGNMEAIDVESGPGELIYICNAKGIQDDVAKDGFRKTQMALQDHVRNNPDKIKDLIDNEIKLTLVIQSKENEDELFRVSVNPWEIK